MRLEEILGLRNLFRSDGLLRNLNGKRFLRTTRFLNTKMSLYIKNVLNAERFLNVKGSLM